jgi:DNA replication protein DnaC
MISFQALWGLNMIDIATLPFLLKSLRLGSMRTDWQDLAEQAEKYRWTYPQYLATLCDRELANREQRRIEQILKDAKLPIGKTLDSFEFGKLSSLNPAQVSAFAETTDWLKQAHNLLLFGPSGVGKSHLAAAIGRRLIEQGMRVLFTKTTVIVQQLQRANNEQKLAEAISKLDKFDLLILDDIGYVKKTEAETSVLFELISDRYERRSLLITSNHTFEQWDTIFPNTTMAVAATDRLVHHATIISINEPSYRKASRMNGFEARQT